MFRSVLLFGLLSGVNSKPATNGPGPNCPACSADMALPCGVTLSKQIVQNAVKIVTAKPAPNDPWTQLQNDKASNTAGSPRLWVIEADTTNIMVWPEKLTGTTKLSDLLKSGGGLTAEVAAAKIKDIKAAAPGWLSHNWGKSTNDKTKSSYVASAKFNDKTYYFAAGYVDAWATYDAAKTDECLSTYATWCAQAKAFKLSGKFLTDMHTAPDQAAKTKILNHVTDQTKYKDGLFYLYVVSYEQDAVNQAKLLQHGEARTILNRYAHQLTYNDKLDKAGNAKIGHQLAKDIITQSKEGGGWVAYTWYRPAASTHANPTNKKYAYIMPLDYVVAGSTDKYSIGVGFDDRCGSTNFLTQDAKCPNSVPTDNEAPKACGKCEGLCLCGNGQRNGNEVCDDGNQKAGDGCSHDCDKVELGFNCTGGSNTAQDKCTGKAPATTAAATTAKVADGAVRDAVPMWMSVLACAVTLNHMFS